MGCGAGRCSAAEEPMIEKPAPGKLPWPNATASAQDCSPCQAAAAANADDANATTFIASSLPEQAHGVEGESLTQASTATRHDTAKSTSASGSVSQIEAACFASPVPRHPSISPCEMASPVVAQSLLSRASSADHSLPGDSAWVEGPWSRPRTGEACTAPLNMEDIYDSDSDLSEDRLPEQLLLEGDNPPVARRAWPEPPVKEAVGRWAEPVSTDHMQQLELLRRRAWEVLGVLRPKLSKPEDLNAVMQQIARSSHFLAVSLPRATESLGLRAQGLVFQGLLLRAGLGRGSHYQERPSADRLDSTFGQVACEGLALSCKELCELLRVKIEDDGDLDLARHILEDSKRFFRSLTLLAEGRCSEPFELLRELRGQDYFRPGLGGA